MNVIAENFGYKITLLSGKEIVVEGHKGLSSCSEQEIVVRVRGGKVAITGSDLLIDEINHEELFIRGIIDSIGVLR